MAVRSTSSSALPDWPLPTADFQLERARTALVIVDMQEMQCRPGVGIGLLIDKVPSVATYFWPRLEQVVPHQRELLEHFRSREGRILYLTIGPLTTDGDDLVPWRRRRNAKMNANAKAITYYGPSGKDRGIISEIAPLADEVVLNKATFGGFASTGLEHLLRNWDTQYLVICGQATNVCVYMTAAEAADRGFECVVVEDACAAWDEELHTAALLNFALLFGRVSTTDEVLMELDSDR